LSTRKHVLAVEAGAGEGIEKINWVNGFFMIAVHKKH
jgi:hypothetical protein